MFAKHFFRIFCVCFFSLLLCILGYLLNILIHLHITHRVYRVDFIPSKNIKITILMRKLARMWMEKRTRMKCSMLRKKGVFSDGFRFFSSLFGRFFVCFFYSPMEKQNEKLKHKNKLPFENSSTMIWRNTNNIHTHTHTNINIYCGRIGIEFIILISFRYGQMFFLRHQNIESERTVIVSVYIFLPDKYELHKTLEKILFSFKNWLFEIHTFFWF